MLERKISSWPLTYLRLPLGGNLKARVFWDLVRDKISKILDGWKKTFFVFRWKNNFSLVLLILHPYLFPLVVQDSSLVAAKIEKTHRDFFG